MSLPFWEAFLYAKSMIQQLIQLTNHPEFYQNCDLKTESYGVNLKYRTAEIILSINQISYDEPVEYEEWKISGHGLEKIKGFDFDCMMPYVKMRLLEKHPLLWKYHDDELECEIKGTPANINKFVFDLIQLLEKKSGNWIDLKDIIWNFRDYMFKIPRTIKIPKSLEEDFQNVCAAQNLSFKVNKYRTGIDKGYANKPFTKLLMFGNEDVSAYESASKQPYMIAEKFDAERIK